ncbi:MAG TPA: phosphatidate cytidylyltransferase [Candidatus Limnocylindrales bacterium]|nr:phosphatidate cytidylyltransferase [Candidatus Limnocylindrales bacterium]
MLAAPAASDAEVLRERISVALVAIPALVVVLLLGQPWLGLLILAICGLAAFETFELLRQAGYASQPTIGTAICLLAVAAAWVFADREGESATIIAVGIIAAAVAGFSRPDPFAGFQSWLATAFGALYVALLGFLLLLVENGRALPAGAPLAGWLDGGRAWLLIAVVGVWAYDSGAYGAGRTWGKHGFASHISPSKTMEGVAGGLVAATVASVITLWAAGQPLLGAIVLGPLVGLAAQAGDLAESMLKRAASVKDSSDLIPGHGGMLDRVDSLLFAGPAVYFYLLVLGAVR